MDVAFSDVSFQPKILNVFETSGQETLFVSNANPLCFVFTPGVSFLCIRVHTLPGHSKVLKLIFRGRI